MTIVHLDQNARRMQPGNDANAPRRAVAAIAIVLFLIGFLTAVTARPAEALPSWTVDELAQINTFRASNGLGPLTICQNLMTAAQNHAADMVARNYFSHTTPEGVTFDQRATNAHYNGWFAVGENIAAGQPTVNDVMAAWLASPGHRANLLTATFTDVGLGLAFNSVGQATWVQDFGAGGTCGSTILSGFDSVISPTLQTLRVRGWAYDALVPLSTINVDVYVDGARIGGFAANGNRPDVAIVFPEAGPNHGFDISFNTSAGPHSVCAYAIGTAGVSPLVGCQTLTVASADPIGSLDAVSSPSPGVIALNGWTLDPEAQTQLGVHVYVDGVANSAITANTFRNDIGLAFPTFGPNHGYATNLRIDTGGIHQVCTYGINVLLGNNRLLGCRSVLVANASPTGSLDSAQVIGPRLVNVTGWSFDPEVATPISVDVYADGANLGRFVATTFRSDIAFLFPGSGGNHGYSININLAPGAHFVCVYGINVGASGTNTTLGCRTLAVPADPMGNLDSVTYVGGNLVGAGWAVDPDTAGSIDVHVYVDNVNKGSFPAAGLRNDVAMAFSFFGPNHGFTFSIAAGTGSHTVCAYGINTGGGTNALLRCIKT